MLDTFINSINLLCYPTCFDPGSQRNRWKLQWQWACWRENLYPYFIRLVMSRYSAAFLRSTIWSMDLPWTWKALVNNQNLVGCEILLSYRWTKEALWTTCSWHDSSRRSNWTLSDRLLHILSDVNSSSQLSTFCHTTVKTSRKNTIGEPCEVAGIDISHLNKFVVCLKRFVVYKGDPYLGVFS